MPSNIRETAEKLLLPDDAQGYRGYQLDWHTLFRFKKTLDEWHGLESGTLSALDLMDLLRHIYPHSHYMNQLVPALLSHLLEEQMLNPHSDVTGSVFQLVIEQALHITVSSQHIQALAGTAARTFSTGAAGSSFTAQAPSKEKAV
jgi:hypothetical protein